MTEGFGFRRLVVRQDDISDAVFSSMNPETKAILRRSGYKKLRDLANATPEDAAKLGRSLAIQYFDIRE